MHNNQEGQDPRKPTAAAMLVRELNPLLCLGVVALLLGGCRAKEEPAAKPEAKEGGANEAHAESRVKQGTNGQAIVTLNEETRKQMGLETRQLEAASIAPAMTGYGRVLDITPLVALVAEQEIAKAAVAASESELNRLRTLAPGGNASERSLQSAQATAVRDHAQVESVKLRLLAGWGHAIAERPDLGDFVRSLASMSNALVELSLPVGEALPGMPLSAQVAPSGETNALEAQLLGPATEVEPSMQGRSFLFLVPQVAGRLFPGRAVSGPVLFPGKTEEGALLPDAAVLRHQGDSWVYASSSEGSFERVKVDLGRRLNGGWFVHSPKPGTAVVTTGAQQMLSEELKGQGGEE